jgi:hypothetical protein
MTEPLIAAAQTRLRDAAQKPPNKNCVGIDTGKTVLTGRNCFFVTRVRFSAPSGA